MASQRARAQSHSLKEQPPHQAAEAIEKETQLPLAEQYTIANDVSNIDASDLHLGLGSSYEYSPSDFSNHGVWDFSLSGNAVIDQIPGMESMHIDPALFSISSLLDSGIAQGGFANDLSATDYIDSWTQLQSTSPGNANGSETLSTPLEADFQSQMRQLSMMSYPRSSLPRRRSRYFHSGAGHAMPIPIKSSTAAASSDPMQRWRDSPPETEAVSMSAIADALKTARPLSLDAESFEVQPALSRAASTGSLNSDRTSASSRSAASARSSKSRSKARAAVTKTKRFNNTKGTSKERRIFQCTFCCDSFKSKYDWSRHEKSLHLSLEGWLCTPNGGAVISSDTGRGHCAYCNMLDPSPEHLETHNYSICQPTASPRIFHRKDHLVQHLRLSHQLETLPLIDGWKIEAPAVKSRCGFCDIMMETWKERVDHLAQHFRRGKTMEDWKGDHCFEPAIAAMVTNACPPYILGTECKSPVPFSATDSGTKDHYSQIHRAWAEDHAQSDMPEKDGPLPVPQLPNPDPNSTFVQVLTSGLARFARGQMELGIVPTDEMFQNESRRLVYGSADAWDQTIADNSEWLSTFRSQNVAGASTLADTQADREAGGAESQQDKGPML